MTLISGKTASNNTCPSPPSLTEKAQQNIFGDVSFNQFAVLVGGAATALGCLVSLFLMTMHATHISKPREQYKIMKICLVIPWYSITSFLSICFPNVFIGLSPWFNYFEGIALATLFLLMCEYIAPSQTERELFFSALEIQQKKGPTLTGKESLEWYRAKWIAVFQLPVVCLIVAVLTDVTQAAGVYCEFSTGSSPLKFAHFWLSLASNVSTGIAVTSIIKFYMTLKPHIAEHKPLLKIVAFKLVVGITFLESLVFWVLQELHQLNPTPTLTFGDLNVVLPSLIICLQNILIAIFFIYAYPYTPYIIPAHSTSVAEAGGYAGAGRPRYQGGFLGWRAWVSVFNPMEVARGVKFAFTMASQQRNHYEGSGSDTEYVPLKEPYGERNHGHGGQSYEGYQG
ncbi:hypothetical protein G7Y89_g9782 [Cudoniella acicularis]|uniref:Uncharacterized protein n=1 Tax=Cudoniella acicularis TaxID=354080 RepID=A0A8H4RE06_9HELO|nr:hypothetical protein G7Y89_g9782 [Cudoniella acicularis]